jgi:hypothetical protein
VEDVEFGGSTAEYWSAGGYGCGVGFVEDGIFGFEGWVAELVPFCQDENCTGVAAGFIGIFVD